MSYVKQPLSKSLSMSNSGEVDTSKCDTINVRHNTLVEANKFHVLDMNKPPILELYKKDQGAHNGLHTFVAKYGRGKSHMGMHV